MTAERGSTTAETEIRALIDGRARAARPRDVEQSLRRYAAGDDPVVSHSLNRMSATRTGGQQLDMRWRATICYRRIDGAWTMHEHASVPFDAASGRASLDLEP
jgi:hypothetical protein